MATPAAATDADDSDKPDAHDLAADRPPCPICFGKEDAVWTKEETDEYYEAAYKNGRDAAERDRRFEDAGVLLMLQHMLMRSQLLVGTLADALADKRGWPGARLGFECDDDEEYGDVPRLLEEAREAELFSDIALESIADLRVRYQARNARYGA